MDKRLLWFLAAGLAVALVVAGVVSGFASKSPDGLEKVATQQGFDQAEQDSATAGSPLADYAVTGVDNGRLSTGLAGVIGVAITLAVGGTLFYGIRLYGRARRRKEAA
jgi:hypothetical protein